MSSRAQKPPLQALLGTVLFVPTVPGTVVGVMPWWLSSGWRLEPPFFGVVGTRWVGVGMMLAALPLFVKFLGRFVFEGHGTPAPVAPTKHLVVGGPFRWVRNPGYVAVVSMIVGQGLVLGSAAVLVYALAVAAAFQGFVVLYEEPTLRRTFGAEYDDYCRRVPRWIPRHPRVR